MRTRTAETHKLRKGDGSAWNPRRNREPREKRLGVWLVTARQEPRPTGRAAVTGGLGSWAFFAANPIFLAADGTRMERGPHRRPNSGRRGTPPSGPAEG